MIGFTMIIILAAMGGVIAYIGDKLGTKVGKKKLSLFGLRPKHTSIIVTIITGILIASSTLSVLAVASQDVRTALFGMEELRAQLNSLAQEVGNKTKELEAAKGLLDAKTAELSALDAKVKESTARLAIVSEELAAVTAERDRTVAALAQLQLDYAAAQQDLTKAKTELDQAQSEIIRLQTVKQQLDEKVASLTEAKSMLQADVDRLNALTANLKKGLQIVREGTVIYRAGEILNTSVIKGGQNRDETSSTLTAVLYQTNQNILERLRVEDRNLEVLWISKEDFEQVLEAIGSQSEDVVVRVVSAGNIVYGEPVIGKIELYPNRLLYSKGSVVYTEVVNVGDTSKQAEEAVLSYLQKVNAAAVKRGILFDPLQGTVGQIGGAQLFDIINRAQHYGNKVELTAITQENIYTVGPLTVEVQVKPTY